MNHVEIFIVRIYRHEPGAESPLAGLVESADGGAQATFHTVQELASLLGLRTEEPLGDLKSELRR